MNAFLSYLQSWAFLIDYVRIAALSAFYISAFVVVAIVAAALLFFLYKVAAAGWHSFYEGLKSEPLYTGILAVLFVFFGSGILTALLEPTALSALLKGFVFL